ncbi:phosphoglycerate kinase [Methylocystis heyeri]|uniref:Phosphoglycerate kinase n=1 Tax=Methylocystis heyeri TaxID=391905 RepID=A0A6B8KGI9_9HYPH|nr:phosphoglycerate kinase [Methylocystis heyeri]QGM45593.1 phosphoglycerate kinase [Methylocystis heyeri]
MSSFKTLDDIDVKGKRVLLRVDLNVPMENGRVADATRIERVLPTIREIADKGGKVVLLAHFGRPKGAPNEEDSLRPVAGALEELLGRSVAFAADCIGAPAAETVAAMKNGDVALLENTRFHKGEEKNDAGFADELAKNGDIYVNDAFSAAHRAHASTEGLAHKLPSFAGRAMQAELEALEKALGKPQRPVLAVVGGAKISTKLDLLGNLVAKVDYLVIGGGMANTFLAAQGKAVGKSLCEKDLLDTARDIIAKAKSAGCEIVLPEDVTVAQKFEAHAPAHFVTVDHVGADDMILDVGPKTVAHVESLLAKTKTLVWNGPFGAFELPPFDEGTSAVAQTAARLTREGKLLSVAGGGDTVSALNQAGAAAEFTYVSTAGGAFLEWLEGKELPGVAALAK